MTEHPFQIREDDATAPEVVALLERHLAHCRAASPPEFVFALDLEALRKPEISFWTLWDTDVLLACGALSAIDETHGEIKTMHTTAEARGRGIAQIMLDHIITAAVNRGMTRLSLETGTMEEFAAGRRLYKKRGFQSCGPFADYEPSDYSEYFTLEIQ